MGINVQWDNPEQTVILYTFQGDYTWEDCKAALQYGMYLQDTVAHPVSYIYDTTRSTLAQRDEMVIMQRLLRRTTIMNCANLIHLVIVERGAMLRLFITSVEQVMPTFERTYALSFARTVNNARLLLADTNREPAPAVGD